MEVVIMVRNYCGGGGSSDDDDVNDFMTIRDD